MINFMPFPKLETKNIVLRRMNYNDINDLFKMRKDPEMNEYVDTKLEENPDETKAYIDKMNKGVDDEGYFNNRVYHMVVYRHCKICFPNLFQVKWSDFENYIEIDVPEEFSFQQCMVYLNRSDIECLHRIKDGDFYKLLKFEDINVVIKISMGIKKLKVTFMDHIPAKWVRAQVAKYLWDMFDLGTDLTSFYELAENDSIIRLLIDKYKGLRIVKINDMFEAICWAIIGQQINLKFAYTLKKRLVECYGEKMIYDNEEYFLFPTPEVISKLEVEDLKPLQFTTRKAEYIIGIAKLFQDGDIKKEKLVLEKDYEKLRKRLTSIRGIGNWTADYTIMKCFDINDAFPIADVGIHNALKGILGLDRKPTIEEIEKLSVNWKGWQAYATFYLWRWLYD